MGMSTPSADNTRRTFVRGEWGYTNAAISKRTKGGLCQNMAGRDHNWPTEMEERDVDRGGDLPRKSTVLSLMLQGIANAVLGSGWGCSVKHCGYGPKSLPELAEDAQHKVNEREGDGGLEFQQCTPVYTCGVRPPGIWENSGVASNQGPVGSGWTDKIEMKPGDSYVKIE